MVQLLPLSVLAVQLKLTLLTVVVPAVGLGVEGLPPVQAGVIVVA
jgi:hypothetical protein